MVSNFSEETDFVQREVLTIDDLETLKVIADPLRLRILELLEQPSTVKQIAEKLDLLPTKLYYHVNLLEKHNLIAMVETRVVSGIIEKHYQTTARRLLVDKQLLSTGSDPEAEHFVMTINSFFETTREEALDVLRGGDVEINSEADASRRMTMHIGTLRLTDDEAQQFYDELEALMQKYRALKQATDGQDRQSYRMLYVLFPKDKETID